MVTICCQRFICFCGICGMLLHGSCLRPHPQEGRRKLGVWSWSIIQKLEVRSIPSRQDGMQACGTVCIRQPKLLTKRLTQRTVGTAVCLFRRRENVQHGRGHLECGNDFRRASAGVSHVSGAAVFLVHRDSMYMYSVYMSSRCDGCRKTCFGGNLFSSILDMCHNDGDVSSAAWMCHELNESLDLRWREHCTHILVPFLLLFQMSPPRVLLLSKRFGVTLESSLTC